MTSNLEPSTIRLLLVEDEHILRRMLHRHLEQNGFVVVSAYDGQDALAAIKSREIDALIVDVNLPGASGTDVARLVLERHPGAKLLYISGEPNTDSLQPAAPVLAKPFSTKELVAAIRKLFA